MTGIRLYQINEYGSPYFPYIFIYIYIQERERETALKNKTYTYLKIISPKHWKAFSLGMFYALT